MMRGRSSAFAPGRLQLRTAAGLHALAPFLPPWEPRGQSALRRPSLPALRLSGASFGWARAAPLQRARWCRRPYCLERQECGLGGHGGFDLPRLLARCWAQEPWSAAPLPCAPHSCHLGAARLPWAERRPSLRRGAGAGAVWAAPCIALRTHVPTQVPARLPLDLRRSCPPAAPCAPAVPRCPPRSALWDRFHHAEALALKRLKAWLDEAPSGTPLSVLCWRCWGPLLGRGGLPESRRSAAPGHAA